MKVSEPLIEVKQSFQQPIEKVWKALTDVKEMSQWLFENIPSFEPSVGFKTQFTVTSENR